MIRWRKRSIPSHDRGHHFTTPFPCLPFHPQHPSLSTLNSSAEHEQHQSCRPYPAWCIGIASSRGMSRASRLPSNGPPRLWMRSLQVAHKHNSSPYSYATHPSTRSTSLHASAKASHAGTALPAALSRPPSDTSLLALVLDPSSTAPLYPSQESAPRLPSLLVVLRSRRRSDRA
jgi:hypothetical protein